jgi:hypothetical protein
LQADERYMKPRSRLCLAVLFSTLLSGPVLADSIGFPKDKPAFTIEVPAGWKADYNPTPSSVIVADAEMKNTFMAIAMPPGTIISDKDAAAATLKKFLEQDLKENIKDETFTEPAELTIAGEKAYSIKATTKDGGPTNEFLVFSPDGKSYFVGMRNGDVKAILDSIKTAI